MSAAKRVLMTVDDRQYEFSFSAAAISGPPSPPEGCYGSVLPPSPRKRKTPEEPEHESILEQLDCTKEHLRKLGEMLRGLPCASDPQSYLFRNMVACDVWSTVGEFYRDTLMKNIS